MIPNILCICRDTGIFGFAKKEACNSGEHDEFARPSVNSQHHAKTENVHFCIDIGDHQACDGGY